MSKHARVIRNILALLINQVGTWTITVMLTLVIPRYLGVQLYGLYAFVGSYTSFFAIIIGLGTATYLTWRIAREPQIAGRLTFNTLMMQVPLCGVAAVAALLLMPLMDGSSLTLQLTAICIITTGVGVLISTCAAGLAGLQIMRTPALISLASSALGALAVLVGVGMHVNVLGLAYFGLGAQVFNLTAMLIYTQRKLHMHPDFALRAWPKIALGGMPFFAWSAVLLWYGQIDVTLLKILVGNTEVGWYAVANRIVGIPVFLPTIVVSAILPALAHERVPTSPHFQALASRSIRLVMLVGIPAAVGTILLSDHLISMLHFPASFNQVGPVMVLLGLNMSLVGLNMVLGAVLIAAGRQNAWTAVGILSAVFNPLANLWAIPFTQHMYGNGAIGAAAVTLATEFLMFLGAMVLRPKSVFTGSDMWYITRCLLAAAVMIPAVKALASFGTFSLVWAVTYGVIAFGTAAYTLQLVTNKDILSMLAVVRARMGLGEETLDGRQILQSMRGLLATPGSAAMAWSRTSIISRPLSAVVRTASAISQPLATAVRETAHRLGSVTSRPHTDQSGTSLADGDADREPAVAGMMAGDRFDPLAIPLWDIAQFETAPLDPSMLPTPPSRGAESDGRAVNEDEQETSPAVPRTATSNGNGHHSTSNGHEHHSHGARNRLPEHLRS